jgi:hypothetical protein
MKTVSIETEVEIYLDDIIEEYEDDDLISEIEKRGYNILTYDSDGTRRQPNQGLHEELCDQFSISRFSSKQQLISHINSLL